MKKQDKKTDNLVQKRNPSSVKLVVIDAEIVLPDDARHPSIANGKLYYRPTLVLSREQFIESFRLDISSSGKEYLVEALIDRRDPDVEPSQLRFDLGLFSSEKKAENYANEISHLLLSRAGHGGLVAPKEEKRKSGRLLYSTLGFGVGVAAALASAAIIISSVSQIYSTDTLNTVYSVYADESDQVLEGVSRPAIDQNRLIQLPEINQQNVRLVGDVAGIAFPKKTPNATPFYVFSRLNCDDCDTVNRILDRVSPDFQPIVMPASFDHDLQSAQAIGQVYCADDPAQAWVESAQGKSIDSNLLCGWNDKAQVSSKLADLIAVAESPDDWPLIVAPNGKVSKGSFPTNEEDAINALNEHLALNR